MAVKDSLQKGARTVGEKVAASTVVDLRRRVKRLEDEVQECRAINIRLAELTDLVTELLLPVAQRDEARIGELVERYQKSL
jgi:hypothetical protein